MVVTLSVLSLLTFGMPSLAFMTNADDGAGETTAVQRVLADKNVVVACYNANVENNGDTGKAGSLKNGGDHYSHLSYLSFTVTEEVYRIASAKLRLTPIADKANTKLGVYEGPAVSSWPTSVAGMLTAADEPDQVARAEHNCPSGPNTLIGQYEGALTAGTAIEVDVGSLVDGPGTYALLLRGLAGVGGDYSEYLSLYRDPGTIDNTDHQARPQLVIEYEGGSDGGGETPAVPPADCTIVVPVLMPDATPHSGQVWGAGPGAKVCIEGGLRATPLLLANLQGTADNPVEVVSYGGVVDAVATMNWDAAMDIRNSKFFKINGQAEPGVTYGFKLANNAPYGFGLQAGRGSTNYTIQGVEIAKAGFAGFMLRSDVSHGFKRASFTQQDIAVRNNKIAHVGDAEAGVGFGIMVGVANFGTDANAHETKGLRVHHNLVEDTKRDGILIYGASEDVRVYGNVVADYAQAGDPANDSGILIGTGSSGEYYGNFIKGKESATTGKGINNQGRGDVGIYGNLIVDPGSNGIASPAEAAYVLADDPLFAVDLPTAIRYNTIVHPLVAGSGILLRDSANGAEGNKVDHNLIVHSGGSTADYIAKQSAAYPVAIADNYTSNEEASVRFVDASAHPELAASYALEAGSPAAGYGFLPGMAPPPDERYDELAGWTAEDGGGDGENPVDPLDPEFDYEHYVPDPVTLSCDFTLPSDTTRTWDGDELGVAPGSTVCVEQGLRPAALRLINFHGTAEDPITFINHGGVVTIVNNKLEQGAVIKISGSSHVRLTGTGDRNSGYGFRLKAVGDGMNGLVADSLSTDIEIDHVEVFGAGFAGFMLKSDPNSNDSSAWRDHFTMTNVSLWNNYIHDVSGEGMYIGNSFYNTGVNSNGVVVWPHAIKGLYVYDNRIERTGWDGMQIGSATEEVAVHGNVIQDYGLKNVQWQDSGMQVNPGTTGAFYNNMILRGHGTGSGINNQGRGNQIFYNNLIVDAKGSGIINMDRLNPDQDSWYGQENPIYYIHNTIVNPGTEAIHFYNKTDSYRGNAAINNLIVMGDAAGEAFHFEFPGESELARANNFIVQAVDEAGFVDAGNGDYRLQAHSDAVDYGADPAAWAAVVGRDLAGNKRPSGDGYDAGAYEFQKPMPPTDGSGGSDDSDDPDGTTSAPPTPSTPSTPTTPPTGEPDAAAQPTPQPVPSDARQHWANSSIQRLAELGALVLEKDGSFRPNKQANRAEFIDMLVRALNLQSDGAKSFADTQGHWARASIAIAASLGLVSGYDDSTFGPDRQITRQEMAVVLARALKLDLNAANSGAAPFRDGTSVASWAQAAVRAVTESGLISGYPDGSFQPTRPLSRAEAAVVIVRLREWLSRQTVQSAL